MLIPIVEQNIGTGFPNISFLPELRNFVDDVQVLAAIFGNYVEHFVKNAVDFKSLEWLLHLGKSLLTI